MKIQKNIKISNHSKAWIQASYGQNLAETATNHTSMGLDGQTQLWTLSWNSILALLKDDKKAKWCFLTILPLAQRLRGRERKKNWAAWLLLFYGTRYWVVPFSLRKLKLPENNRLEIWPEGMWYTVSQKCSSPKWAGKGEGSTETVRLNMQHACKEPPNKHAEANVQSLRDPPGMG